MTHPPSIPTSTFPHERLDAYRVAVALFAEVERLAPSLPRGCSDLKDQLRRAAGALVRNLAEGANRAHPRDKAARFSIAAGESAECDAALEMAAIVCPARRAEIARLRGFAHRVGAMLCGLVRSQRRIAGRRP